MNPDARETIDLPLAEASVWAVDGGPRWAIDSDDFRLMIVYEFYCFLDAGVGADRFDILRS